MAEANNEEANYHKISFELEQDENGYPPNRWETLWAYETEPGHYCIDNIPFYVDGVSSGDVVSAEHDGQQLLFKKMIRSSSNTVFRLYISDPKLVQQVRDEFRAIGCASELSNIPQLIAVEVPGDISFGPVAVLLEKGEEANRFEYDEGVFRH